jgi:hypothetical protein
LFFADAPYGYAGNNPLSNVDPSGQKVAGASGSQVKAAATRQAQTVRVLSKQGNPPKCDTLCQDATRAQNDALAAENAFHDALDTLGQLAVAQAFLSVPIAQITKLTLEELSKTVVFQLLSGAIAGVGGELLMGYAIFKWEASQSLSWFRQKGNVDAFFTWAPGLVAAVSAVAGLVALTGSEAGPVFAAFAVGVLVGGEGVISTLNLAHAEQDREYR